MQNRPSRREADPGKVPPEPTRLGSRSRTPLLSVVISGLLLAALSGGCAQAPGLPGQLAELSCIGACQGARDRCNADARYDYRQCQAGYSEAFVDYRWCLASAFERSECGYPWWPCAENLYGYCANRAAECEQACRPQASPPHASTTQSTSKQPNHPAT
ncbi:hypothetical protein [Thiocapsa bogorovii]|uniref:hypothetical protein n=1 Tax=Thiocapsa bogorovii TaxID=521689 RepID=UPI001E462307|nr:hypothetical protein [Thiocapsa bogorovii]UHD15523.1 hypothetical protein LT988_20010 [Thiocapsa bogorovii]